MSRPRLIGSHLLSYARRVLADIQLEGIAYVEAGLFVFAKGER